MGFQAKAITYFSQKKLLLLFWVIVNWEIARGISQESIFHLIIFGTFYVFFLVEILRGKSIYLIVSLSFLIGYIIYLFDLPAQVNYLIDGLIISLIIITLGHIVTEKRDIANPEPMLLIWICYMLVELIANCDINYFSIQSLVAYFLYPLLYLVIVNSEEIEEKKILTLILFFVAIQIPVTMIQKAIYYYVSHDRVGGTLGRAGTQFMGVLMAGAWSFVLAYLFVYRKRGLKAGVLLILPFIPLILGEIKAGFLLAACGGLAVYLAYVLLIKVRFSDIIWSLGLALPIMIGYVAFKYFPTLISPDYGLGGFAINLFSSWDNFVGYLSGYHSGGSGPALRLQVIFFINKYLAGIPEKLLGAGPGLVSSSGLLGIESFQSIELTMVLAWITSFGKYYIETGIIGVALYILVIMSLAMKGIRLIPRSDSLYWKTVALGFVGYAVVFIAASVYTTVWNHDALAASFWICAALVTRAWQRENKQYISQPTPEVHEDIRDVP